MVVFVQELRRAKSATWQQQKQALMIPQKWYFDGVLLCFTIHF